MKVSFSTLGCPGWTFDEVFSAAKDLKYDGIEIRIVGNEFFKYDLNKVSEETLDNIKNKLQTAGLEIPVLDTDIVLALGKTKQILTAGEKYINFASKLNIPYIRVMPTFSPDPKECDLIQGAAVYAELCDYAKEKNISVLIETNGVLADSREMKNFMVGVGRENSGVLWDVHHPYRYFNETPEYTVNTLKELIKHVHVKDSVKKDDKVFYRMMGFGDVPVLDALKELKKIDFDGFISLEWVKRWQPDLEEGGIVFAHFQSYMNVLKSQI